MSRPQNFFFESYLDSKNRPLGLQKVESDSKIKSNINFRIEGIMENESCATLWVDLKTVYELQPFPKIAEIGQKDSKWQ